MQKLENVVVLADRRKAQEAEVIECAVLIRLSQDLVFYKIFGEASRASDKIRTAEALEAMARDLRGGVEV